MCVTVSFTEAEQLLFLTQFLALQHLLNTTPTKKNHAKYGVVCVQYQPFFFITTPQPPEKLYDIHLGHKSSDESIFIYLDFAQAYRLLFLCPWQ